MKILIIRFSSIGDIVLTTPVIRCIKSQIKGVELHFLLKKEFFTVLKNNPYLDKIHTIESKVSEVADLLEKENFDIVIDLHHNLRSLQVKKAIKTKHFSFNKLNYKKWLLVNFKVNKMPQVHIVDRYMETVKQLNVVNDGLGLDYFIKQEDEVSIKSLPEKLHNGFISLVLGGTYFTKQIPLIKLEEICRKSKLPLVLLGGKSEHVIASHLTQRFGDKVFNACGKYSLNQSASLIKSSQKVFTSDTGLMHIAAAFKKDIISLWGNTVPEFGMTPYLAGVDSKIIENKNLKCRPCSKLGYSKCPRDHFKCMLDLVLEDHLF
jgi:ADP-heptose:LPS heptosyltransferase